MKTAFSTLCLNRRLENVVIANSISKFSKSRMKGLLNKKQVYWLRAGGVVVGALASRWEYLQFQSVRSLSEWSLHVLPVCGVFSLCYILQIIARSAYKMHFTYYRRDVINCVSMQFTFRLRIQNDQISPKKIVMNLLIDFNRLLERKDKSLVTKTLISIIYLSLCCNPYCYRSTE